MTKYEPKKGFLKRECYYCCRLRWIWFMYPKADRCGSDNCGCKDSNDWGCRNAVGCIIDPAKAHLWSESAEAPRIKYTPEMILARQKRRKRRKK